MYSISQSDRCYGKNKRHGKKEWEFHGSGVLKALLSFLNQAQAYKIVS